MLGDLIGEALELQYGRFPRGSGIHDCGSIMAKSGCEVLQQERLSNTASAV